MLALCVLCTDVCDGTLRCATTVLVQADFLFAEVGEGTAVVEDIA